MKPRVYVYKITFEEVSHFYHGWHKEKRYGETYWGSPITNKNYWLLYTPVKEIICEFPYTDEGEVQAKEKEILLISENWDNPLSLNRNKGGFFTLTL